MAEITSDTCKKQRRLAGSEAYIAESLLGELQTVVFPAPKLLSITQRDRISFRLLSIVTYAA